MNNLEPLDRRSISHAARQLAAVRFTHPGSAPTRARTLIDSVYTRAQIRAERRCGRRATAAA
ncbi:hypothetical protein [Mycolicibacterium mageritense]|uniref:hypothetical protein n=1 Tax=Mycolicibacterium mageritense TaxID=53462 RepID=UPI0011DB7241|nr:hypothetical protein [Mycolicibacterium mageritense]TXI56480.1 MAG: hypothetical protein E6Q55_28865 [Mycolicibacterium mageritense]